MTAVAETLAGWAAGLEPGPDDLELADRSLRDTAAVALAARDHRVARLAASSGALSEGGRWAVAGHILDFDDLHMPSTAHVSVVCVPAALAASQWAAGDGARAYLAAAGVMARLGTALGWRHYAAGWHATCTAGAPAAAAGAAVALGLDAERIAVAMALAVPAAGGVQRAFGTDAKSLQVGMAVDAGLRAARLAAAGAQADPAALDTWLQLVGGDPAALGPVGSDPDALDPDPVDPSALDSSALDRGTVDPPAVDPPEPLIPNGLAIKLYPCCYALQRPIAALAELGSGLESAAVRRIVLRTPEATVVPLIHHRPESGLQGKFSLEYAAAAALLDSYPGFGSFTDEAVGRDAARRLAGLVEIKLEPGGDGLLDGELEAEIHLGDGTVRRARLQYPPGSPARPPTPGQLRAKLDDCVGDLDTDPSEWTWENVPGVLRRFLPGGERG